MVLLDSDLAIVDDDVAERQGQRRRAADDLAVLVVLGASWTINYTCTSKSLIRSLLDPSKLGLSTGTRARCLASCLDHNTFDG